MAKGNGAGLAKISKDGAEIVAQSKALAQALNNRKYKQADVYRIIEQATEYIEEQQRTKQPLTIAGFCLACNIPLKTWYEMRDGDKDHITSLYALEHSDYIDENGEPYYVDEQTGEAQPLVTLSQVVKNCYLCVQNGLETNCYTNKGNPAGSIFGLKAQFGWSDDTTPQHLTQVVQICDAEQAKRALEMLHG